MGYTVRYGFFRRTACRELCLGLAYLHELEQPITHRDIKPSNLLFKGTPLPRCLIRIYSSTGFHPSQIVYYTVLYSSP